MLIPSYGVMSNEIVTSLSRRVNANSQRGNRRGRHVRKLIKKGEC